MKILNEIEIIYFQGEFPGLNAQVSGRIEQTQTADFKKLGFKYNDCISLGHTA